VETVAKTGNWVINLASYTRESTANRKLALFQQQGVDAEVFAVEINGKPMYRIRLAGFQSRRAAQAEVKPVEQLLGLEGVWVSKR
jgi:cell division septation protein DedD